MVSVLPQSVSVVCEVLHVGVIDNRFFTNDDDLVLKVGDKLLVTFMVALFTESQSLPVQAKKDKVQQGAVINIYRPALKVVSLEPSLSEALGYHACLICYRFGIKETV